MQTHYTPGPGATVRMTRARHTRSKAHPTGAALLKAVTTGHKRRPAISLGQHVRTLRLAAGLTHAKLGEATKYPESQMSRLEGGINVEVKQYAAIAKVLGFTSALEMFRADAGDPRKTHLLRGWAMCDDAKQVRLLKFLNRLLLGEV